MKHWDHGILAISADAHDRLERFAKLVLHWNARINLVGRADEARLWTRHILDCAQIVPLLPVQPGRLIDFGSGAGFPGMVLALLTPWRVELVEADRRKAAFLRESGRILGVTVIVHAVRAEDLQIDPANAVTARALAPLVELLALTHGFLEPGGVCVFPKGRNVDDELTTAAREWHMHVERHPSHTSADATLLRLSEIRRIN